MTIFGRNRLSRRNLSIQKFSNEGKIIELIESIDWIDRSIDRVDRRPPCYSKAPLQKMKRKTLSMCAIPPLLHRVFLGITSLACFQVCASAQALHRRRSRRTPQTPRTPLTCRLWLAQARRAIEEVLVADPRSTHWRQQRASEEFGFCLDTLNVVCSFADGVATVTRVHHLHLSDRSHMSGAPSEQETGAIPDGE